MSGVKHGGGEPLSGGPSVASEQSPYPAAMAHVRGAAQRFSGIARRGAAIRSSAAAADDGFGDDPALWSRTRDRAPVESAPERSAAARPRAFSERAAAGKSPLVERLGRAARAAWARLLR